ncbi:hypothetical protein PQH03_04770 [Ralstonia insidiosa]|jgi:hypothetical protein|uniref:hypothetical protein n=2 Tax=Bacteria TaxID=2 RepID=UPI000664C1A6|nr:hypothetical protein [Ralstonia insidiosa]KMW48873.1 hypothetical protein AC240_03090 [Ralstonia sp. MD27]MBX3773399.1 hypothetical protein [Ralstonia pickettii]NOZ18824.1 hypothetical protein [Betaproteobacteria bacterium]MBA9857239.1 hypothetical protein [Ralstonia insidiosa]MBA9870568.1 hypothetical protein [Ralstonia insidiosa]
MQIEELYQAIGKLALRSATDLNGRLLVYAEVQTGVIESALFYERGDARVVTFRHCNDELLSALYEIWERWQEVPGNEAWFCLSYLVQGGKFQIDLAYPDQIDPDEGTPERRPRMVRHYFGEVEVDYSAPYE